jgi:FR47-like protein
LNTTELALNKLEKDKVNNISIINFIKNNQVLSIDIIGNSILVRGKSDRVWVYISCNNEEELDVLKNKLTEDDINFGAIDEWMIPMLVQRKKIIWDLDVLQFYLPEGITLPPIEYETQLLMKQDAATVYLNSIYKEYLSIEYISEQIDKGISSGIYENSKLISWGMLQDDGAIGFLHTLENYRRKRFGYNVALSLTNKLINSGKLPFAYIERSNSKSANLFLKLGFKENKKAHWFQIK